MGGGPEGELSVDGDSRPGPARLGELVRGFRRRAGLTQQEAAGLAAMSVAALRDLEQGRVATPRPVTVRGLAVALELSAAETESLLRLARAGPATGVRLRVLGPLLVSVAGEPVDLGSPTQRALLGLLALSVNTPVPRDALLDVGWGDRPPPRAADLLQTHISRLRRRLRPPAASRLTAVAGGYQLTVDAAELDMLAFRDALAAARQAGAAGDLAAAAAAYERAIELWRGDPLEDVPAFRLHPAVVALVREWQAAVVEYATVTEPLGRHDRALPLLEAVVEADPLHEAAHARLLIALAGTGQQAAALARYDRLRRRLAAELGADPAPELVDAHRRVLRQEIAAPAVEATPAHRQLPPDLADFTGRQAELAALCERLPGPGAAGTALVISAIEGMAGVGKTRLAVHLAHRLVAAGRYTDAQLYADLRGYAAEPPADPATVLASFLHLLGVPGGQIPADLAGRSALYRDRLAGRNALVLLDNAADEKQVLPLLPASPTNLVLVTSRRTLALDGGRELAVDVFTPADAVALLARIVGAGRAAAEPDAAAAVVELCGRLPLAVALAARRLQARPVWTLADLAGRLADGGNRLSELTAGARQLRAVFDLSYRALDDDTRRLFRLLGLHPGDDVSIESAAALADLTLASARRLLDTLVDEHLATPAAADRYRLHDLLREYAGHVAAAEDSATERAAAGTRLLDYYVHAADRAAGVLQPHRWEPPPLRPAPATLPALAGPDAALHWLATERANLTAAVHLAAAQGHPGHAWRLTYSLGHFLYLRGYPESHAEILPVALAAARAAGDEVGTAVMLTFLGIAVQNQSRAEDAIEYLSEALALHRQSGSRTMQTTALVNLGGACYRLGRFAAALEYVQEAVDLCAGYDPFRAEALRNNLGALLTILGRPAEALGNFRAALALARRVDDGNFISGALANLGDAHRRLGQHDQALAQLREALAVATEAQLPPAEAYARYMLGRAYLALGRLDEATAELTAALDLVRTAGGQATEHEILIDLGEARAAAGDLADAAGLLARGLALAVETGERYAEARASDGLARLHAQAGDADAAADHRRRARDLFAELGTAEAGQR
ncbi:MAG: hypothetical protein V7637_928 [Mycobacteriales bacterium]